VKALRLGSALTLTCLFLASCGDQSSGNASSSDAVIKEAQALEKRANDQVNETIATIEAENKDAMAATVASETEMETNTVESGNQN
jgi:uncharacterized protein YcfL